MTIELHMESDPTHYKLLQYWLFSDVGLAIHISSFLVV